MHLPKDNLEFPLVWDSTMRASFVSCPTKCYWEFFRKVAPNSSSIHLHFGAVFARGLEVFRKTYYKVKEESGEGGSFSISHDVAELKAFQAMAIEWGEYEELDGSPKTFANCVAAMLSYFSHNPPETDHIQPYFAADGTPAVEFRFAVSLEDVLHPDTGEPLIYAGRFDELGLYNNQLFVADDKTSTQLGSYWSKQWDLRGQFIGYVYGAQQFDYPVAGALVRGTAIKKSGIDHADAVVPISNWLITAWREQLARDLERAKKAWEEGWFDQDFDQTCTAYGGCSYKVLCQSPQPERWAKTHFVKRVWNPLAKDPTAEEEQK